MKRLRSIDVLPLTLLQPGTMAPAAWASAAVMPVRIFGHEEPGDHWTTHPGGSTA